MDTTAMFSLAGRSALVTGGSRGIGKMIAEGLLRQGARVYISARKADACNETADELSSIGHCVSLPADVSSTAGIAELVAAYESHEKSLDILVNNA
ncbi:MAG: SDR family NAD(P)-dependent oxidoreductase, partial [Nocardioides sp.]|nr:SDR family NAD(P)-dependent oxidoreductase [Nocardioides sp.]